MGIRFAKSIKIGNYLKLNFSKSGVSASVGKKGASVNIGKKGTFLNLSPSAVGINGTGLSYRQRIAGGKRKSYSSNTSKDHESVVVNKTSSLRKKGYEDQEELNTYPVNEVINEEVSTENVFEEYRDNLEAIINIHKYTDNVLSKKAFDSNVEKMEDDLNKKLNELSINGDEDVIENMVSSFMNNLTLAYDVRVNYELEDHVLYVDLDLPEIEDLDNTYPVYKKDSIVYKKKSNAQMKEEYARLVLSLSIFLSANYFNLSSYIDEIVISGFTSLRNKDGDLVDQYLYSIRYLRSIFEKCDLSKLDDLMEFIMRFENRINLSKTNTFKAISPYETKITVKTNELIEEAVLGLKQLGYKSGEIDNIRDKLSEYQFESSGEYLKQALRLLKE